MSLLLMKRGGYVASDEDAYHPDEPQYNAGVDTLIVEDDFSGFATIEDRYDELVRLRTAEGMTTHSTFVSDARTTESPGGTFYDIHQVITPGLRGSARALRARYLGETAGNQLVGFRTWPQASRYSPTTARIAGRLDFRVSSEDWVPEFPGWKFFELWYSTGGSRIQASVSFGAEAFAWWRVNISNTEVGAYVSGRRVWADVNQDPTKVWRLTFDYQAASGAGAGDGYFKGFIGGVPAWDVSAAAVARGEVTQTDLERIEPYGIHWLQWPDTLNVNLQAAEGLIDYGLLRWWKVGA